MGEYFRSIRTYPERQDANGVVMRLIDGLGYRFYWATEGLTESDLAFSPGGECMTVAGLIGHIWGLANWVHLNVLGSGGHRSEDPMVQRAQALEMLLAVRNHVEAVDEQALFATTVDGSPFWHVINGPLSDAISHAGQIASFRRINGNAVPKHHVFLLHEKDE